MVLRTAWLATFFLLLAANTARSQTLFTYGNHKVDKQEFLKAFNKNPSLETDRKKALNEYLQLYIRFRLKVQAALDAGLNKDPNYLYESENFRKQLAANFINEEANIKALVKEAFERSTKDILLQQVFIPFADVKDTAASYAAAQKAYFDLRAGKSLDETALKYGAAGSKELGWITVFTFPYVFENVIYQLSRGQYSQPVRSSIGYHLFYNAGERAAAGRRKTAQILLAIPPGASAEEKATVGERADSIRKVLMSSPEKWNMLVQQFSNDNTTADRNGEMQEFGIGEYSPAFENAAYRLVSIGEISPVVETSYGFHILKLLKVVPIPKDIEDPVAAAFYRERLERDDRLAQAKKMLVSKWMKQSGFRKELFNPAQLWAYTDSFYNGKNTGQFKLINDSTVLFRFTKRKVTALDFATYNRSVKTYPMYQSMTYDEILEEFYKASATDYYQTHLSDFNKDFATQLKEFNEANLLFAIMDKEVWNRSATDEAGLKAYYEQHKAKYQWEASAQAVVFTVANEKVLKTFLDQLQPNPERWKEIAFNFPNEVMADSNRFELGQLPVKDRTNFTDKLLTAPVKNADGSYSFAYVIQVLPAAEQRSFEDARGLLVNDYQQMLEEKWIESLKKKYPVRLNQSVVATLK